MSKTNWKYKVVEYVEDINNPGNARGFDVFASNSLTEIVSYYRTNSKTFPDRCFDIIECDKREDGYYYLTRKQLLDIIADHI